jgi:anti-anti-sigma factor
LELFTINRGEGRLYADRHLVVTKTHHPAGLRFVGEIDVANAHSVTASLASVECGCDIHIDVTALSFCDVSGIRAFVTAAEEVDAGRRLILHGLPDLLQKVIMMTGWGALPSLVLCHCQSDQP